MGSGARDGVHPAMPVSFSGMASDSKKYRGSPANELGSVNLQVVGPASVRVGVLPDYGDQPMSIRAGRQHVGDDGSALPCRYGSRRSTGGEGVDSVKVAFEDVTASG